MKVDDGEGPGGGTIIKPGENVQSLAGLGMGRKELRLGPVAGDVGEGPAGEGPLHEPLVVEIDPHPSAAGDPEGVPWLAGAGEDFRLGGARRKHPVGLEADLAGEPPDGRLVPIDTGGDRVLIDRWHRLAE